MLVEVFLNGKLVLSGKGEIEEIEEGQVELIVNDENDFPHIVQMSEEKYDEVIEPLI